MPMNAPRAGVPTPGEQTAPKTEEEIAQETADELAAQQEDLVAAQAEMDASYEAMGALEDAFIPHGIFRHRGAGPLQYETKRGLIKVFSGDLVAHIHGPTNRDAPQEEWEFEEEWIVVSEAVLGALLFTVDPKLFPETLEVRAGRIGEERRAAAAAPPPEGDSGSPESDAEARGGKQPPLGPHQESGVGGGSSRTPGGDRMTGRGEPPSKIVQQGGVVDRFAGPGKKLPGGVSKAEPKSQETQTGGTTFDEGGPNPEAIKVPSADIKPGIPGSFGPDKSPANFEALKAVPYSGPAWAPGEHIVMGDQKKARWNGDCWEEGDGAGGSATGANPTAAPNKKSENVPPSGYDPNAFKKS